MVERVAKAVARSVLESVGGDSPWVSALERTPLLSDNHAREAGMFAHRSRHFRPGPMFMSFVLFESLFWGAAAACLLLALHRIARALHTQSQITALRKLGDAYTDEEREVLVHRIKGSTLGCL